MIERDRQTEMMREKEGFLGQKKSKKSVKIKKIKDLRIRDSVVTERGLSSANEKIKELLV